MLNKSFGCFILYVLFVGTYGICSYISYKRDMTMDLSLKIQNTTREKLIQTYKNVWKLVFFNVGILTYPIFRFLSLFVPYNREFKFIDLLWEPFAILFLLDVFFFTTHYLFHCKFLYKKFHNIHHKITAPIGLSALYHHPIDYAFSNIIPSALPVVVLRSSVPVFIAWAILTAYHTVMVGHGGIKNKSEQHDIHHSKFTKNYGTGFGMDLLFGTSSDGKLHIL
tara:strand:- start:229 stop:897 length:669 start_codon:yes stop_codon:yes gene_type:complete